MAVREALAEQKQLGKDELEHSPGIKQLNFRKVRQEFTQANLKEGKALYEKGCVESCDVRTNKGLLHVSASIRGQWNDLHASRLEFRTSDISLIDSECDCPQKFECQHLAALLCFLEEHGLESKKMTNVSCSSQGEVHQKHQSREYAKAYQLMRGLLVQHKEDVNFQGYLLLSFTPVILSGQRAWELQFGVKKHKKSRITLIQSPKQFLQSLSRGESIFLGSEKTILGLDSFGPDIAQILYQIRQEVHFIDKSDRDKSEKNVKGAFFDDEGIGRIFSLSRKAFGKEGCRAEFFYEGFEKTLQFSEHEASFSLKPCFLEDPFPHYLMGLVVKVGNEEIPYPQARCILSQMSGLLYKDCYYPFSSSVTRQKIQDLETLSQCVLPLHIMPCFIEEVLPQLHSFLHIEDGGFNKVELAAPSNLVSVKLTLDYAPGELKALVNYQYGDIHLPHSTRQLAVEVEKWLCKGLQIPQRNLKIETDLISKLLREFTWDDKEQVYHLATDRAIVSFVSSRLKEFQGKVEAEIPPQIAAKIKSGSTHARLEFSPLEDETKIHIRLHVDGILEGIKVSDLREALNEGRSYLVKQVTSKGTIKIADSSEDYSLQEVEIVLVDYDFLEKVLPLVEELGFVRLATSTIESPLWALLAVQGLLLESCGLCVVVHEGVRKLLNQFQERREIDLNLDESEKSKKNLDSRFESILRGYQKDGVLWLKLLKKYGLAGILADDMGLGKTLQTIALLSEVHLDQKDDRPTLVVCPTSLIENWKDEIQAFEPNLVCTLLQGVPEERKSIISAPSSSHIFVTSYGILQKDIEILEQIPFSYVILDEAQNIKNKETRTARAVKKLKSKYRLVLTGTPVENSLEDLWSLFDFLMPGFLGSWEKFSNAHMKPSQFQKSAIERLKVKIAPFVMRRMKQEVLSDLPSITRKVISCQLQDEQRDIYRSYSEKAAEELLKLVEKDGFEKSKMHVLATITRLKQICCHPKLIHETAAKSAKYELFWDLLTSLFEAKRKVVVFSQFTSMLALIKEDLEARNIRYAYLDGGTRNRQGTVKEFNEDQNISVFLVSLRAGGVGLNLVGADSVIHYDIWWNPAVENQATDRVWRLGQKLPVTSYKLITKGTVEERIVFLQERKKELIGDLVLSEEDVLSRLKWEEVLELLRL